MAKVVSMPGCGPLKPTASLGPVPNVVEKLEGLLAEAKHGEVRAIGFAIVRTGNEVGTSFAIDPDEAVSHLLVAATAYLHAYYVAHKMTQSEKHRPEPKPDKPA